MSPTVRIAVTFWGDHRGPEQRRRHDAIEEARWRLKVAANERKRTAALPRPPEFDEVPPFMRRQAL